MDRVKSRQPANNNG